MKVLPASRKPELARMQSAETLTRLGLELQARGKPRSASEAYEAAIARHPAHGPAHKALAGLVLAHGGPLRLLPVLERAIAFLPGEAWALHHLGQILCGLKRFEDAVPPLRRAAELQPGDAGLLFDLGVALQESGDNAEAIAVYRRALHPVPQVRIHHNLASALQFDGRMEEAMREYASAWALNAANLPRIVQDLAAGRNGRIWLNIESLKRALREANSEILSG